MIVGALESLECVTLVLTGSRLSRILQEDVVNTGGSTLCTVLRAAQGFRDNIVEQFELHRAHRASGNTAPTSATLPAILASPDIQEENGSSQVRPIKPGVDRSRSVPFSVFPVQLLSPSQSSLLF